MLLINKDLQAINSQVEIYGIGDCHIGSSQFNEPLLVDLIHYILAKKNRYVIFGGDILDCTYKDSKGCVYQNDMQPQVALAYGVKLLKPLCDKGRVLCCVGGNHDDNRSMQLIGISMAQQFAVLCGIPELYTPDECVIFANVKNGVKGNIAKDTLFKINVAHGMNGGGGSTPSKMGALERMSIGNPTCDVYVHFHTHSPMTFKDNYISLNDSKRTAIMKERMYVNGNAFLKYFNGYGEQKLMKPQSMAIPVIKLCAVRSYQNYVDRIHKVMSCEI